MRALNPAGPLDHRARQDTRLAQHLQRDARPDNIHNRVHRAHLVEVHLLRRQAVNLAFRHGEALEDRHRLLFHPVGELAFRDQLPDLSEGAAVLGCGMAMRVGMAMGVRLSRVVMLVWPGARRTSRLQGSLLRPRVDVQVIALQPQLLQLLLQLARLRPPGQSGRR